MRHSSLKKLVSLGAFDVNSDIDIDLLPEKESMKPTSIRIDKGKEESEEQEKPIKPMLACDYKPALVKNFPVIIQPKLDGMRVLIKKRGSSVDFMSRNGKFITSLNWMIPLINTNVHEDCILDSEMTSTQINGAEGRWKRDQAKDAKLHIFDVIREGSLEQRRQWLESTITPIKEIQLVQETLAQSHEDIKMKYEEYYLNGYEGIMIKILGTPYVNKRCKNVLKLKPQITYDLLITGIVEGSGKYEGTMGALVLSKKNTTIRCGTGFTDVERQWFWANRNNIRDMIVEIEAQEETTEGSLRHPRFKRLRFDRDYNDFN